MIMDLPSQRSTILHTAKVGNYINLGTDGSRQMAAEVDVLQQMRIGSLFLPDLMSHQIIMKPARRLPY